MRDMLVEDPRDLPTVACHLQRDLIGRRETGAEQLKLLMGGGDPPGRPDLAVLGDRDLTEIAMHV